MRFIVQKLVVYILTILLAYPAAAAFAQNNRTPSGQQVLASQHKFSPNGKENVQSSGERRITRTVRLTGAQPAKAKPAPVRPARRALSSLALQKKMTSMSAFVMDGKTGRVLYSHAPDLPRQPASTIKVLTGLIAIDSLSDRSRVPTSRRAANMPRSKVYLKRGHKYEANDLINAVLLASANDASVALAEKIAGSERVFAKLMTEKARIMGARNTVCKTATGLTARGQKSTARDLAMVFNAAMEKQEFAERIAMTKARTKDGKVLRNHNKALWQVTGAEGGKTGYTRAARQTYVGKFRRGEDEVVVAIMGSETMWDDISNLVEYGFARQKRMARQLAGAAVKPRPVAAVKRLGPDPFATLQVLSDKKKMSAL